MLKGGIVKLPPFFIWILKNFVYFCGVIRALVTDIIFRLLFLAQDNKTEHSKNRWKCPSNGFFYAKKHTENIT